MTLENAKKILKYFGILIIIGAIVSMGMGVLMTLGGGYAATSMPEVQSNEEYSAAAGITMIAGVAIAVGGLFRLFQGLFSLRASKNSRYGKTAWIFSILGVVAAIGSAISTFTSRTADTATIIGQILAIIVSICVLFAAKIVKDDYVA